MCLGSLNQLFAMTIARLWVSGFLVLGVLLGLVGSLSVAWQYHIDVEPQVIGLHFLALNAGYIVAAVAVQHLLPRISTKFLALLGSGLVCFSLFALSIVAPPFAAVWRLLVLFAGGSGAGALGTSLLYVSESNSERPTAAAVNKAGVSFGCGCLLSTIVLGATYLLNRAQSAPALLALLPLTFLLVLARTTSYEESKPVPSKERELRETLRDVRSIATVLFSLLLFFQFGNEWALAGWLPLFLVHRLGTNPVAAIGVLALYFMTLMLGRVAALRLLPRVSHRKLLIASIAAAVCGFMLLTFAVSLVSAAAGVIVIGIGFGPIYPLIADRLDQRFSCHPRFYNGALSIAITGAMSAPCLLGFIDASLGMRYIMLLPAFGSVIVLMLSLLLMLEAHLMSESPIEQSRSAKAGESS